jgi:hypothetical protein
MCVTLYLGITSDGCTDTRADNDSTNRVTNYWCTTNGKSTLIANQNEKRTRNTHDAFVLSFYSGFSSDRCSPNRKYEQCAKMILNNMPNKDRSSLTKFIAIAGITPNHVSTDRCHDATSYGRTACSYSKVDPRSILEKTEGDWMNRLYVISTQQAFLTWYDVNDSDVIW